jgi:hypothetical protein
MSQNPNTNTMKCQNYIKSILKSMGLTKFLKRGCQTISQRTSLYYLEDEGEFEDLFLSRIFAQILKLLLKSKTGYCKSYEIKM